MTRWDDLEQDEIWLGQPIVSLEDDHLANLQGWLFRHAGMFHSQMISDMYYSASHMQGEMAQDSMDSMIAAEEETNPLLWMEQRSLFKAVRREIQKRQGVHVCRVLGAETG